jgi:hypothetical protein
MEHRSSPRGSAREPEPWKEHANKIIKLAERQVFASRLLTGPCRWNFPRFLRNKYAFALVLLVMIYFAPTSLAKLLDPCVPSFTSPRIISAVICVLALVIVDFLRTTFFAENVLNVYKYAKNEQTRKRYDRLFQRVFSKKAQLIGATLFLILPLVLLVILDRTANNPLNLASGIIGVLCLVTCSHGAYFALRMPVVAGAIAKSEMEMFWIHPADTSWIKTLSFGLSTLTLSEAFAMALGMPVIYKLKSMNSPNQASISGWWLVIALCVIVYGYLYPQFHFYRAISAEKDRQIQAVQQIIDSHRDRLEAMGEDERRMLWQFVDLTDRLSKARESAFDSQIVTGLVTSFVLPIGGFILAHREVLSIFGFS